MTEVKAEAAERLKFQIDIALAAIRTLILINGGAILALLTFIGNSDMIYGARPLRWAFGWFIVGLTLAMIDYFAAFLSQVGFMNARLEQAQGDLGLESWNIGDRWFVGGIIVAGLSLVCFAIGAFVALGGLLDR